MSTEQKQHDARRKLPSHERHAVTDAELRTADQVSDAEFFDRIGMPELIGLGSRSGVDRD